MSTDAAVARAAIATKLAESRTELRDLLTPEDGRPGAQARGVNGGFPRSRTMRALMSGGTLGVVATVAGAFLVTRPHLLLRLGRLIPVATIFRLLSIRYITHAVTDRGAKS